jgi:general nucleoside transport system permease protein
MGVFESILITIITASTPLLLASIGELVTERAGVLNLGVEGMMVMGAVVAFAVALTTGSPILGALAGALAGVLMALLFGFLTLTLVANQVATGLALTILGLGLSGLIGEPFVGQQGTKMGAFLPDFLKSIPFVGPVFLGQDLIFFVSIALVIAVHYMLFRTRTGLVLRSVGDSHSSAHALGINVIGIRYLAVMFGGACSGLAGAYLSLVYTPQWVENMTAGRGWIALALVVFAGWKSGRVLIGAYLFGFLVWLELFAKGNGFGIILPQLPLQNVPSQFWAAMPYLMTIVVLAIISARPSGGGNAPACLGKPFLPSN